MRHYATGILSHHWWGEYSATITLKFQTPADCTAALVTLRAISPPDCGTLSGPDMRRMQSHGWVQSGRDPSLCAVILADPVLQHVIDALVSFGANRNKITSLAKSVDCGEPFTVEIPGPVMIDTRQLELTL